MIESESSSDMCHFFFSKGLYFSYMMLVTKCSLTGLPNTEDGIGRAESIRTIKRKGCCTVDDEYDQTNLL